MTVQGLEMQVASATIPTFMTWASICPNPAMSVRRPAASGIRTPADRIIGLTISPGLSANCSTRPSTPARITVLSRSTCASASAASALAFSAGRSALSRVVHFELFDVALRNNAGVALLQFAFGVEFVGCLLQRAFGLLKLAFRLHDVGLRRQHGGIDFGDLAPGGQ